METDSPHRLSWLPSPFPRNRGTNPAHVASSAGRLSLALVSLCLFFSISAKCRLLRDTLWINLFPRPALSHSSSYSSSDRILRAHEVTSCPATVTHCSLNKSHHQSGLQSPKNLSMGSAKPTPQGFPSPNKRDRHSCWLSEGLRSGGALRDKCPFLVGFYTRSAKVTG